VTQLQYDEESNTIISGGKDKALLHWQLPLHWRCQKLEAEEESEHQIQTEKN
jgi:hypothetical protein